MMMKKDFNAVVDHVANLARLMLEPGEKKQMAFQLESFLEVAMKIQELDTAGVEPTSHVLNLPAVMRDDEIKSSLPVEKVLQNAPVRSSNYFKVPQITVAEES
jgi:aspartyl-tRNA(Asn)/glutamyl-tRNA(Gln) amidotransferase subunit C